MSRIWKHLSNWTEGYLWVPLVVIAIWGSGKMVEGLTGNPVKENIDWLIDYQAVAYKCVYIIVLTSIMKQATGSWMTKEEKFTHPYMATVGDIKTTITFLAFVWLFGR
jgi:hypothetical protein